MSNVLQTVLSQLNEEEFDALLEEISPQEDSKGKRLLQILKEAPTDDALMPEKLRMTKGAFYTLKSRLVPKVVTYYTNLNQNKVRQITEEAARIPFIVFNNERDISLSYLKDLEKRLKEYDLSSELALVYKHLARLQRFTDEHKSYEREYQKHIAFSLAVSKAEDLLYEFIYHLGYYRLTGTESYKRKLDEIIDELENTYELYESHRLFVIFHVVKIYHQCCFQDLETLRMQEVEIEEILGSFISIFNKYPLDPFYSELRHVVLFIFFEFYVRVGNRARSKYYNEQIAAKIGSLFKAHLWSFFITQFIISLIDKLKQDGDMESFQHFIDIFDKGYDVDENELSHLIIYFRYRSLVYFYKGEYSKSARVINNLRNITSFKNFPLLEVEIKLFQAMMYSLGGEEELFERMLSSAKRQARELPEIKTSVKNFSKILLLLSREKTHGNVRDKLAEAIKEFEMGKGNTAKIMSFLYLKEEVLLDLL